MTNTEKIAMVGKSQEVVECAKLLIAAFYDCELNSHIRYTFTYEGRVFELNFMELKNQHKY